MKKNENLQFKSPSIVQNQMTNFGNHFNPPVGISGN